ncbi:MerC domain-containing protein [Coraliomargarita sp. W4R53]
MSATKCRSHGWLDHLAIGMAAVCAFHCLLTPILVIALPIIATSFFVHEDFHVWMILLVLPTTSFAIFMGCRRHKDRWVAALSAIGLSILVLALVQERWQSAPPADVASEGAHCPLCVRDVVEEPVPLHAAAWINTLGGLFLASAHIRNFRLCRKSRCDHEHA